MKIMKEQAVVALRSTGPAWPYSDPCDQLCSDDRQAHVCSSDRERSEATMDISEVAAMATPEAMAQSLRRKQDELVQQNPNHGPHHGEATERFATTPTKGTTSSSAPAIESKWTGWR